MGRSSILNLCPSYFSTFYMWDYHYYHHIIIIVITAQQNYVVRMKCEANDGNL